MSLFNELKRRGLIAQTTHEDEIKEMLDNQQVTFYIGFDPTADSLHVGHFLQLIVMAHMQRAGHNPIALIGGGTAMVGDPSGRTDMRSMMTTDTIQHNGDCFKSQLSSLVQFGEGKAIMVNNADWLLKLNYIDFLRDVGVNFSVNRMLTAECFKSRLEKGLSFIEFNYMLMQSYDFLVLHKEYGCSMQLGGDDQWSNILGGIDLVRRVCAKQVFGMTFTLLTTSEGKKMGKTAKGALWLDPEKTTPFEFYQYFRNVEDVDVIKCLKLLTFIPIEEIEKIEKNLPQLNINDVKERMAYEVTKLVHGETSADTALKTARDLFNGGNSENMASTEITSDDFTDGTVGVIDLLIKTKLAPSKGEARRLIEQGGVLVNSEKVVTIAKALSSDDFKDGHVVIQKGKKAFHKVILM